MAGISLEEQVRAQFGAAGQSANVQAADPRIVAASIVQVLLGLLGTIFLVLLVTSGYWLITSRGNEEKIEKAKKTIRGAVVGLILVLTAYAITSFVTGGIRGAVGG